MSGGYISHSRNLSTTFFIRYFLYAPDSVAFGGDVPPEPSISPYITLCAVSKEARTLGEYPDSLHGVAIEERGAFLTAQPVQSLEDDQRAIREECEGLFHHFHGLAEWRVGNNNVGLVPRRWYPL